LVVKELTPGGGESCYA